MIDSGAAQVRVLRGKCLREEVPVVTGKRRAQTEIRSTAALASSSRRLFATQSAGMKGAILG